MTVLNQGGLIFRDVVSNTITYGKWGTGTTSPTVTDTGLVASVAGSEIAVTKENSGQSIRITHELNTVTANTNTLAEYTFESGSTALTRMITTPFSKNLQNEVQTISILFVDIN
jgi:hypothetical protein